MEAKGSEERHREDGRDCKWGVVGGEKGYE